MDPFQPYTPRKVTAPPKVTANDAEAIALQAIAYIAADEQLLSRFVALTGCGLDDVRARVTDKGFLGAVLDFVLGDEATVVAFAEHAGLRPEAPMLARAKLP
jgi:hypothetical protein